MRVQVFAAAALLALAGGASMASAQPLYGIMFRTGGQTSGAKPVLYDVNPVTGAASNGRDVNVNNCVGIAVDPFTGVMYGLTDQFGRINNQSGQGGKNLIFTINPATGAATGVGRIDPSGSFQEFEGDIAFNPIDGSFWGVTTLINTGRLFQINKATGAATLGPVLSPVIGTDVDYSALAFDHSGNMFVLDTRYPNNPGPALLEKIDPTSGAVLQWWDTGRLLGNVAGMAFAADGRLLIADGDTSGTNRLYSFDLASGTMTNIGPTNAAGGAYQGLAGLAFGCTPGFAVQPQSNSATCPANNASFSVQTVSSTPVTYQWQIQTGPTTWMTLGNDPGPLVGGGAAYAQPINSASVRIGVIGRTGTFAVRCTATNVCGANTSAPATFTINPCLCSIADVSPAGGDGVVDGSDFVAFINSFAIGDVSIDPLADVAGGTNGTTPDPDGVIDGTDFVAFINAFALGC